MTALPETPRRPRARDVAALIGLLAVLEGEVWAADTDHDDLPAWAAHLAQRLARDGLLAADAGNQELRRALGDLNQRLRYVLGEHDDPDRTSS
jgi:hypothetical protein